MDEWGANGYGVSAWPRPQRSGCRPGMLSKEPLGKESRTDQGSETTLRKEGGRRLGAEKQARNLPQGPASLT